MVQVASLHSQLAEVQQARHSLAVRLASLQAQLHQPGTPSGARNMADGLIGALSCPSSHAKEPRDTGAELKPSTPGKAEDAVVQQIQGMQALQQVEEFGSQVYHA